MVTQIDPISTPPTPADTPADFEQKASQVWGDLFKAVPQMNSQALEIEAIGQAAVAAGQSAQEDSDAALGYRNEASAARDAAQGYQTAASGFSAAAGVARTGAESAASSAADAAGRADASAAAAAGVLANAVQQTSATGAAMLPEGGDGQRPAAGGIPAGMLLIRGNTQAPAEYKPEFWDRAAAMWKAFADRTWVGQQIDSAVQAVKNWVDQQVGFTIVYPNGGTAASPANVTVNMRYVVPNPFPGHQIICIPEISYGDGWNSTGWYTAYANGPYSSGVTAGMRANRDIVVTTGLQFLTAAANLIGSTSSSSESIVAAPCRVLVFKVKGAIA